MSRLGWLVLQAIAVLCAGTVMLAAGGVSLACHLAACPFDWTAGKARAFIHDLRKSVASA